MSAETKDLISRGVADPGWFMTNVLDVNESYYWSKMGEIASSVRDNSRTAVQAGHGVSKSFTAGRIALWFLYCHAPSTVVTTAPTDTQVKDVLWREIRQSHANAKVPLGGKVMSKMIDLQGETGLRWFATGFSTRPDTVTKEATAFQGYHNDNLLVIFDEAAGILPEIWRAAEHIGAPFKRFLAIGNPTSGTGDFAKALRDPSYNVIRISVKDTPNFISGDTVIPGVYGREYEERIRQKYGKNSDEYRVRVEGHVSSRKSEGAYYASKLEHLRKMGRMTRISIDRTKLMHYVLDPGYTTALWCFQEYGTDVRFMRYYEDSGVGIDGYGEMMHKWAQEQRYQHGNVYVPVDMNNNAHRVTRGETALEIMRGLGFTVKPLPKEMSVVQDGIPRTRRFLDRCWFEKDDCKHGLEMLETYHEGINKSMSSDEKKVFTGVPEKDGSDHCADALRYASMAFEKGMVGSKRVSLGVDRIRELQRRYCG